MTYKKTKNLGNVRTDQILRKTDNAVIPFDPANTDYQEYLEWLKIDGNVPEAAD